MEKEQQEKFIFNLSANEINIIFEVLGQTAYNVAAPLIQTLHIQYSDQLQNNNLEAVQEKVLEKSDKDN